MDSFLYWARMGGRGQGSNLKPRLCHYASAAAQVSSSLGLHNALGCRAARPSLLQRDVGSRGCTVQSASQATLCLPSLHSTVSFPWLCFPTLHVEADDGEGVAQQLLHQLPAAAGGILAHALRAAPGPHNQGHVVHRGARLAGALRLADVVGQQAQRDGLARRGGRRRRRRRRFCCCCCCCCSCCC
jgi:hypothetical protein